MQDDDKPASPHQLSSENPAESASTSAEKVAAEPETEKDEEIRSSSEELSQPRETVDYSEDTESEPAEFHEISIFIEIRNFVCLCILTLL